MFLQGTRLVLRAASKASPQVFQYQFTHVNGVGRQTRLGAFHASEVGYVFGTLPDSAMGTSMIPMLGDFSVAPNSGRCTYQGNYSQTGSVGSIAAGTYQ